MSRTIQIPAFSMVVLVGGSGSGKSTFAKRHFLPTEVVSSDVCRALVTDDENSMAGTASAFHVLHQIVGERLRHRRLTVVDATNVLADSRRSLLTLAREHDCLPVAIVLKTPEKVCLARNEARTDRSIKAHVIRRHFREMRRSIKQLKREGFRRIIVLDSVEEIDAAVVERQPLWNDLTQETGPFDIIGDIHGCYEELCALLCELGYSVTHEADEDFPHGRRAVVVPPAGRKAVFVGDLVDRGPDSPSAIGLVMEMVEAGTALCVAGNHDAKLAKKLQGRNVKVKHGLETTLAQLEDVPASFVERARDFLGGLISHYMLDHGRLCVAHAGLKESLQGRASGRVRSFAMYGDTTGEVDSFGLPVRLDWASDYRGKATVVYGHTPVPEAVWHNNTIDIDTGCVFGGTLTALRYPERELVSVPALTMYWEPVRPLDTNQAQSGRPEPDVLELDDVLGRRRIRTRLGPVAKIDEGHAMAALETMSRFAIDPRWLIYMPPTMSPSATSLRPNLLEHPDEAFAYYKKQGVSRVICQEKHMGSRAVVVLCRDQETASKRFDVDDGHLGAIYTRNGRPFFSKPSLEQALLARVAAAMKAAGLWESLETSWVCLDCELMPWSAKAQSLLLEQYAPVGVAASRSMEQALSALQEAQASGAPVDALLARFEERAATIAPYQRAYRQYCWPVDSIEDLKLAPFHLLATEGQVHHLRDHGWHMTQLHTLCKHEPILHATAIREVELSDEASIADGVAWWEELTAAGGEGMVVKPWDFTVNGKKGLLQPALKCRGREYLRIIYGPEYTIERHLSRLRKRGLSGKRRLALQEYALGIEGLSRFVDNAPLYQVHETVFAVMALESEPVDPRL